jgi:uncharacterized iron-regulated protein
MTTRRRYDALRIGFILGALGFIASVCGNHQSRVLARTQTSAVGPNQARVRLQTIIKGILIAWDKADVVCLGEDHGSKNDSDLRIALIEDPDLVRKVNVVMVEFADSIHQDILDRLVLEGEDIPREQLRVVWNDTSGKRYGNRQYTKHFCGLCERLTCP